MRQRWLLDALRESCDELDTDSEPFDTLQVVFQDEPESFLVAKGTRAGDRLYQVLVGMGVDRDFRPENDRQFLSLVADQVLRAVRQSPLGGHLRDHVAARVESWRDALGERS